LDAYWLGIYWAGGLRTASTACISAKTGYMISNKIAHPFLRLRGVAMRG
jgi:hypothetical protein